MGLAVKDSKWEGISTLRELWIFAIQYARELWRLNYSRLRLFILVHRGIKNDRGSCRGALPKILSAMILLNGRGGSSAEFGHLLLLLLFQHKIRNVFYEIQRVPPKNTMTIFTIIWKVQWTVKCDLLCILKLRLVYSSNISLTFLMNILLWWEVKRKY